MEGQTPLVTKEELDEALRSTINPKARDLTLDSFVDTLQVLAQGKGHKVVDSAIERISSNLLDIDRWVVTIAGVFMMGIQIGLKIAAARNAKNTTIH